MPESENRDGPKRRRRDRGDAGIWWDKANNRYVGAISLGHRPDGNATARQCGARRRRR
jgi:hypothetical protein